MVVFGVLETSSMAMNGFAKWNSSLQQKNWLMVIDGGIWMGIPIQTSWSLLGLGVEVGLTPNIMKGINIFTADVIKDFSYNYDIIY
jgi:hypothetical protein